jgi:hypothetical protein
LQEIRRNLIVGGKMIVVGAVLDQEVFGFCAFPDEDVGRRNAQVIAGDAEPFRQRGLLNPGPALDPRIPGVGDHQCGAAIGFGEELRTFHQGRDHDGQREGIDAGILFPSILRGGRSVRHDEAESAPRHAPHRDA